MAIDPLRGKALQRIHLHLRLGRPRTHGTPHARHHSRRLNENRFFTARFELGPSVWRGPRLAAVSQVPSTASARHNSDESWAACFARERAHSSTFGVDKATDEVETDALTWIPTPVMRAGTAVVAPVHAVKADKHARTGSACPVAVCALHACPARVCAPLKSTVRRSQAIRARTSCQSTFTSDPYYETNLPGHPSSLKTLQCLQPETYLQPAYMRIYITSQFGKLLQCCCFIGRLLRILLIKLTPAPHIARACGPGCSHWCRAATMYVQC